MKNLIFLVLAIFLTGCGAQVGFNGPPWSEDLSSQVAEGDKKVRHGKRQVKAKKRPQTAPVADVVAGQAAPPPALIQEAAPPTSPPPAFANQLKSRVTPKKGGKRSNAAPQGPDLVGDKPPNGPDLDRPSPRTGKVDIVFIVDSSNSMNHFLRNVKNTFRGFVPVLSSALDWQMMFTNAEYGGLFNKKSRAMPLEDNGKRLWNTYYLTKDMPKRESIFLDSLRLQDHYEYLDDSGERELSSCEIAPGCQSWNEQPLKALKYSFAQNRSFFRPGADVVAIIFSDSDEAEHISPAERTKAQEVVQAFHKQWGQDAKNLKVYGIMMRPEVDATCLAKQSEGFKFAGEGLFGTELMKMVEITEGKAFSLCEKSYLPLAKKIVSDFQK